jgi:hypothetical protein
MPLQSPLGRALVGSVRRGFAVFAEWRDVLSARGTLPPPDLMRRSDRPVLDPGYRLATAARFDQAEAASSNVNRS